MIKRNIPNLFTLANLFCGCIAVLLSCKGMLLEATYLIGIACVFDFLDGFVARLLKVHSELGKQLDSLADMVTFGLMPGIILFVLINNSLHADLLNPHYLSYIGFIVTLFSALRLAIFNIDIRQTDSFIGLPTPANTIFIASLIYGTEVEPFNILLRNTNVLIGLSAMCALWLVMPLPLFALKFKTFNWTDNKIRYTFLLLAVLLLIIFKMLAIPLIIILYLLLSVLDTILLKNKI